MKATTRFWRWGRQWTRARSPRPTASWRRRSTQTKEGIRRSSRLWRRRTRCGVCDVVSWVRAVTRNATGVGGARLPVDAGICFRSTQR
ncbi:unnamed protein product [Ectocarpus sp. 13 AM-2016]